MSGGMTEIDRSSRFCQASRRLFASSVRLSGVLLVVDVEEEEEEEEPKEVADRERCIVGRDERGTVTGDAEACDAEAFEGFE